MSKPIPLDTDLKDVPSTLNDEFDHLRGHSDLFLEHGQFVFDNENWFRVTSNGTKEPLEDYVSKIKRSQICEIYYEGNGETIDNARIPFNKVKHNDEEFFQADLNNNRVVGQTVFGAHAVTISVTIQFSIDPNNYGTNKAEFVLFEVDEFNNEVLQFSISNIISDTSNSAEFYNATSSFISQRVQDHTFYMELSALDPITIQEGTRMIIEGHSLP
jgi:hypothetical protein